jgi:AcrR family transcriptional regulator
MPKIVNVDEKRKWICEKAYEQFLISGINNFSLTKFIASLNMSKGLFYYYFQTKEELIYKVMDFRIHETLENTIKKVNLEEMPFEKLLAFFSIYLNEEDVKLKNIHRLIQESLHLHISTQNTLIKKMNRNLYIYLFKTLTSLIDDLIEKKYLKDEAKLFPKSLIATADGMFFHSIINDEYNLKDNLYNYLVSMYEFLKKYK